MRRHLSAIAACLLCALIAACQPLPQPFAEDRPPPGSAILTPKDGAGVTVEPVDGMEQSYGRDLATAMAAALCDNDVPAIAGHGNRKSYVLRGTAEARPLAGSRAAIVLRWELHAPDGTTTGTREETQEASFAAWQSGDGALLAGLAKHAAPLLAELLEEEGAIDLEGAGPHVLVRPIAGARGDGSKTLMRAMAASLRQAGLAVADQEPAPPGQSKLFVVTGTVAMAAAGEGKEKVTVSWSLFDPGGLQIGQVNQENEVRAGSLDHNWGDVAYAVANAAAGGIVALFDRLKGVRVGS